MILLDKLKIYQEMSDETSQLITQNMDNWRAFLTTASRIYKYNFDDQVLIYAQRPHATACASYDIWNNIMHRYVKRGTTGIGLIDVAGNSMKVKYVFDVADTGELRNSRPVELWQLHDYAHEPVKQMLCAKNDVAEMFDLPGQLDALAVMAAIRYWTEHGNDVIDSVAHTNLSGYDEGDLEASFLNATSTSISYILKSRCGFDPEPQWTKDFEEVLRWNTPVTVAELGKAISLISGQVLRQIEATVKEIERSIDHETELHPVRGLPASGPRSDGGRNETSGQVRDDEEEVSAGPSTGTVLETAPGRETDGTPSRDRRDGGESVGDNDEPAEEAERSDRGTEGEGSDGLGGSDEQSEASGRGSDPDGTDLRLIDYSPLAEQMSFLIPSETEQIQIIDSIEAERSGNLPFASFISQEVIDEILRQGSNTSNHRMIMAVDFMKQLPIETVAEHMQKVYHGGYGLVVGGRQFSAWYGDNGIRIATGKSARFINMSQHVSWEDAAKRIGELMESGQFASLMELATAPVYERNQAAQNLWYMHRDIADDGNHFLPSMETIRGGGFPEETARLSMKLAEPEFLATITDELHEFTSAYEQNRELMRFHYHKPQELEHAVTDLAIPHKQFDSLLTEVAPIPTFITEDEINASLAGGSSVAGGKGRIYQYFTETPAHNTKEKADYLKNEYGTGGRSHAVSGSDHSGEDHDAKGLRLQKQGCESIQLSWTQVASRIDSMIYYDRYQTQSGRGYLTEKERTILGLNRTEVPVAEPEEPVESDEPEVIDEDDYDIDIPDELLEDTSANDEAFPYHEGDTVELDGKSFVIENIGLFDVQLRDPTLLYPVLRAESKENLMRLIEQNRQTSEPVITETVAVYPAEENKLPYDIVIEKISAPEQVKAPQAHNFHITDDHLGEGGPKVKYGFNAEAIRTLKQIEAENRSATPEEQEVLSRYVGWGGIPQAFDENNPSWAAEYGELRDLLTTEEYEAARASTLNAHYTSPVVIRAMYEALEQMGFHSGNILEPSCGVGNFLGMLPDNMASSKLYGVELDSITGRIAKQLYPESDITVAGFETTERKDFYDVAIGNVPFGNYKIHDKAYDRHNFLIHDYFFAKALDQVRPGGVVAFVTSKGTLDKQNPEVRRYLAQRAELVGAIRLPNNAFRANAGTDVTSDIIFLQKRDRIIDIEPDWVHLGETEDGIPVNSYFAEHPEMILGHMELDRSMYGSDETVCVPYEDSNLSEQLAEAVSHITGQYIEADIPDLEDAEEELHSIPADPRVKNYSYAVVDGEVYYRQNSIMVQPKLSAISKERVRGLVGLRNEVNDLIQAQMEDASDETIAELQKRLNEDYDKYTAKYGLINTRANAKAFSSDASYYLLCSLEVINEKGELEQKADMFTRRTIRHSTPVTHVDTPTEALALSIAEKAKVDLDYMEQLTGIDKSDITDQLAGAIFPVPNGDTHTPLYESYVPADEYLSGNVREKLREARQAAEINPIYEANVKALEAAQPKDLDASEIDIRLGATWVDKDYINDFMYETFNTPMYMQRYIKVNFSAYTAEWFIDGKTLLSSSNVAAYVTYGTDRASAYRILEDTLNLRDVRVYDTIEDPDGKERRVLNQKETTLAQQKQQAIKDAFRDWIWKDPYRRETLVTQYNELFNATRTREYDGSHIAFDGMNPEINLREHQRNAVAHILYGGNTLLAHEVGAGKTFEMVAAVMESKRLGLCQKAMFVVPNHLTEQWASEFLRLYPSANILVATRKDFEKANRQKFCARIATGDYDAVILGHSQFERIPVSQERQERLLREQIEDITEGIAEMKHSRGEQFSIKQLERAKRQLEMKLRKLEAEDKKDHVVTFEQLGIDRLYVDEAHAFKNLFLFTKMRNVAGLSASEAQKSSDMFLKCRYMDEITGNRGVVFATGTPISNSMTELYTMQRYLQYSTLQKKNMSQFDCWASTFGETTTAIELAPEGTGYRARTRFAKFFNLPELMKLFSEVADIKTADQLHLPTPNAHYETVVVHPSEYQQEMVKELSERAAEVHSGNVDPSKDNMLKITSDGRKLGLDQRLINPLLPDDPGSKVNACVGNILRIWREGQDQKLAQLVFCDLSTPRGKAATEKEQDTLAEMPEETGNENFNIYDDIRNKLVAQGVPREEIAFIHEANTELRKKELFAKVRSGQVRVLMGSTSKMGAGTNVQKRLIALHDLDCPWRPGDLEQRAGRIVRQGNDNPDVFIYRYVTEGTFDGYLWQTVENKQKFISQIMSSKSPVRSCEDIDETALSYAEIKALCAGDPRIKEKMDLDVDVARLRLMKADHQSKQYRLEDQLLKYFPQEIDHSKQIITSLQKDQATAEAYPVPEEGFIGMNVGQVFVTDKEEAGTAILKACQNATHCEMTKVGSYRGFDLSVVYDAFNNKFQMLLQGAITHRVDVGNDARGNLTRLDNAISLIEKKISDAQDRLTTTEQQMAAAKEELGKPFPHEDELRTKSGRLAELDAELNLDKSAMTEQKDKKKGEPVR